MALAGASAPAGLVDDDLVDARECDPLQPRDLRRHVGRLADRGGEGDREPVDRLERQPVDGGADRRQVAELAAPDLGRNGADPVDGPENEITARGRRRNAGRPRANQIAQPILDLLVAVGDEPLLRRKVVVDRLLGDLGLACDVAHGDVLVAALGEQPGRGIRDQPARARLLALAQSRRGHPNKRSGLRRLHPRVVAHTNDVDEADDVGLDQPGADRSTMALCPAVV